MDLENSFREHLGGGNENIGVLLEIVQFWYPVDIR